MSIKKSIRESPKQVAEKQAIGCDFPEEEAAAMKKADYRLSEDIMTSHNCAEICQNSDTKSQISNALYQKCITCPDYGSSCNGPKLAAMEDIMVVRNFHRTIRDRRTIPMKLIYVAAQPISESTINDYFSHSEKDFKWTTVATIDNGITAICGNRIGKPPLDHPCPASSTEIRQKIGEYSDQISALREENSALQSKVVETKGKVISARDEIKADYASRVDFLKSLADTRYKLIVKRDRWITALCVIAGIALVLAAIYFAWDITNPVEGFFRW